MTAVTPNTSWDVVSNGQTDFEAIPNGFQQFVNHGINFRNNWVTATLYSLNDVVISQNDLWILKVNTDTSSAATEPGVGANHLDVWDVFFQSPVDAMTAGTYDPAGITEQLVGLTAPQTLTNKTLTDLTATSSLVAATGNEVAFQLDYTVNKATSGNDTGLQINMTDIASPGTSLMLDVQRDGVSNLKLDSAGDLTLLGSAGFANSGLKCGGISIGASQPAGVTGEQFNLYSAGTQKISLQSGAIRYSSDMAVNWSSTPAASGAVDLTILRDAANTLAQRNGTNAQTSRLYGQFIDASNGDWIEVTKAAGGVGKISTTKNGTGVAGNLQVISGANLEFGMNGALRWKMSPDFAPSSDNLYDLGTAGAGGLRPKDIYCTQDLIMGGNAIATKGAIAAIRFAEVEITGMSGAIATASALIPAGALVIGLSTRVTTLITSADGATDFIIGDGTDTNRWGDTIAFADGTTTNNSDWTSSVLTSATDVVLTASASGSPTGTFNAGAVRVVVHYIETTAPTS